MDEGRDILAWAFEVWLAAEEAIIKEEPVDSRQESGSAATTSLAAAPAPAPAARRVSKAIVASITRQKLEGLYHVPMTEAALECGVCTSVFKGVCRRLGVPAWPSRKIASLDKLVRRAEADKYAAATSGNASEEGRCEEIIRNCNRMKKRVYEEPGAPLDEDIKRVRQRKFKEAYIERSTARHLPALEARCSRSLNSGV